MVCIDKSFFLIDKILGINNFAKIHWYISSDRHLVTKKNLPLLEQTKFQISPIIPKSDWFTVDPHKHLSIKIHTILQCRVTESECRSCWRITADWKSEGLKKSIRPGNKKKKIKIIDKTFCPKSIIYKKWSEVYTYKYNKKIW